MTEIIKKPFSKDYKYYCYKCNFLLCSEKNILICDSCGSQIFFKKNEIIRKYKF